MKKKAIKICSLCLGAALLIGSVTGAVYAISNNTKTEKAEPETTVTEQADNAEAVKDETVYVIAGADGAVQKIIVSDWIKNALGSNTLNDKTELNDIVNVNGDETYTMGGENARVWDAQGNDIYYQGNIQKELPVDLKVTYRLDGKAVSPDSLAGQSGRVSIRFDYTNKQYETVKIGGKQEKLYVPFAMLTGLILDNNVFTDIEVTNGKLINDGSRTVVAGIAFPGLQEDLALSREKLDIPDYVEITANVKDFALGMTVTVATNELFNQMEPDKLNDLNDLTDQLDQLTDAMKQLMDGSSKLYSGLCGLLDGAEQLTAAVDQLAAGALTLKNGINELNGGAAELKNGASALYSGLSALSANNDTLNDGAKQVFNTLLSTAATQLQAAGFTVPTMTTENYARVLNGVITQLDDSNVYNQALATVTAAVEANRAMIRTQVAAAVEDEVKAQVTAAVQAEVQLQVTAAVQETVTEQVVQNATGFDTETYYAAVAAGSVSASVQTAVNTAVEQQMASGEVLALITANTETQMATAAVQTTIADKTAEQMQSDAVQALIDANTETQVQKAIAENMAGDEVQGKLTEAAEGAKSVIALKASLDSYNAFYLGLQSYTAGVAEATEGAKKLSQGADTLTGGVGKLNSGATELYNGILTMKNGVVSLTDGAGELKKGSMQLSDGLAEFNKNGVQKLVDAVNGDLAGLLDRVKATINVSKNYRNFAGISDEMDGNVKFIYRTEDIGE